MDKTISVFSWLSIIAFVSYALLFTKELFNNFMLSTLDIVPITFGIILLLNFTIAVFIIRKKLKPNIPVLIFQIFIITLCLYLVYYFNFGGVKVD